MTFIYQTVFETSTAGLLPGIVRGGVKAIADQIKVDDIEGERLLRDIMVALNDPDDDVRRTSAAEAMRRLREALNEPL